MCSETSFRRARRGTPLHPRASSRKCPNDFVTFIFSPTDARSPSFLDTQTQERAPMLHGVVAALLCAYAPQLMLQATSDAQSAMAAATAAAGVYHATVTSMGVDATSTTEAMKAAASVYHSAAEFNVPSALEAVSAAASVYSAHGGDLLGDNAAAAAVTPTAVQEIGMGSKSWLPGVKVPLLDAYDMALRDSPFATKVVTAASLACAGDAVAQRLSSGLNNMEEADEPFVYDARRGIAFLLFGGGYTGAFQAVWFNWLNAHLVGLGVWLHVWGTSIMPPPSPEVLAAVKVAINQFVAIPLLYMPLFFAMTGALGGLDVPASIERMRTLYVPILRRNYVRFRHAHLP